MKTSSKNRAAFRDDDQEGEINSDFSIPVAIETQAMEWLDSPMPNVHRKRLELIGASMPRLTTVVRFAPDSYFKAHTHDGGEEFLVLDGVFSDAFGNFAKGSYVRNPPGTSHQPFTKEGCTILVKLRQFQSGDKIQFSINTANDRNWNKSSAVGVEHMPLHQFQSEQVGMYKFNNNSASLNLDIEALAEIYIFSGNLEINQKNYSQGYWLRYPASTSLEIKSLGEAIIWIKTINNMHKLELIEGSR